MTGIYLLLVILLWAALVAWLTVLLTKKLDLLFLRILVGAPSFAAALTLPFIDEIVGREQFQELCSQYSQIHIDISSAAGKSVYFASQPNIQIQGTWIRVMRRPFRFVELTSGKPVVTYDELFAEGGWLARHLGLSEGRVPLLFKGYCGPANPPKSISSFKSLGINYVEPPARRM
ncbi:hypothetical protein [Ramlibacter sp. PS4R-6]|uniref:hypothetical protein n=1 Tax=Ramlibacter sp. PS4R-6 TaxID=3133438 RepID=UPI00309A956F